MSTLILKFEGPIQAWGTSSRHALRDTDNYPSKSGIVGILAAALGRDYSDSIVDLADLRIAVRVDQPGTLMTDFHTAASFDGKTKFPLSNRMYLNDAVFTAAVQGDSSFISEIAAALKAPRFPLFLGRKSCIPSAPVFMHVSELPLIEALEATPWQAQDADKRIAAGEGVTLDVFLDAEPQDAYTIPVHDQPVSFDPEYRAYTTRAVAHRRQTIAPETLHDPMEGL